MAANVTWTPLRNYAGYEHVLGAGVGCVHPGNGNIYIWACEKQGGTRQNLAIYRELGTTMEWQHVVSFDGGVDSESQITPGSMWIGQGGALIVATSLIPKGVEHVTQTGFQGVRCRIPGVDAPWGEGALYKRIAALEARVAALEG